jgi:endonuclease/exonuclease/phosphatase (EEP) superfamily protein YafD
MPISPRGKKSSSIRAIFGMVLLTVGVFATVGTVLGFFGNIWWAFDLMSGYRVQLAILLLAAAALYGLLYARVTALVFAVAAAVNVFLVLPLFVGSPVQAAGVENLKVASYNTARSTTDVAAVVDWVQGEAADVIFLFETDRELVEALELAEVPFEVYSGHATDRVYGIIMLSRINVTAETLAAGPTGEPVLRAEAKLGESAVVLYATRAQRATGEEEAEVRDLTLADVGSWAAAEALPVVVVGPLNTSQWSYAFRDLKSGADLVDSMAGYGFQPSYRADMWMGFRIPADQALYSKQLTTTERSLGPALGSDHLPLRVTFAMAAGRVQSG